jgi:imidazolonepropionase-like amidohydrolase
MFAIKNAEIYSIVKPPFKGSILIEDGKIKDVGENIEIPSGSEIIDAEGKLVFPGFIDAHAHAGLFTEGAGFANAYDINEMTDPITPECKGIDAINFLDPTFKHLLSGGVTAIVTGPGSANVIGGQFALIKTYGKNVDEMIINPYIGLKMAMGENPIRVYKEAKKMPTTRMGVAATLRRALTTARNYMKKWEDYNQKLNDWERLDEDKKKEKPRPSEPDIDIKMEAIIPLLKKEVPARIHCHRADDILTAIRIAEEFDFNYTIEHCTEGWKIADQLAEKNVKAIIGPHLVSPTKWEMKDQSLKNAIVLSKAGVKFCIQTDEFRQVKYLALNAGVIVSHGLSEEEALKAITIYPAEILGISDKLGSIEAGKDADLSIFSGHPFDSRSRVEKAFVNGNLVWDKEKDDDILYNPLK